MTIVSYFTPGLGFAGGSLIGAAAAFLLLSAGEILGASGIVSSTILSPRKSLTDPSVSWKLLFLSVFMIVSNTILATFFTDDERTGTDPGITIVSTYGYLLGGFFVGFGTRLGNGCTTGHGICGMARLSKRSIISVMTFMLSAFSVANIVAPDNKLLSKGTEFLRTDQPPELFNRWLGFGLTIPIILATAISLYNLWKAVRTIEDEVQTSRTNTVEGEDNDSSSSSSFNEKEKEQQQQQVIDVEANKNEQGTVPSTQSTDEEKEVNSNDGGEEEEEEDTIDVPKKFNPRKKLPNRNERIMIQDSVGKLKPALISSSLFALGLAIGGMVLPSKILGFLNLFLIANGTWDPTLLVVMVGGSVVSFISYQFVEGFGLISNSYVRECPMRSSSFSIPKNNVVDVHLVAGAFCFGIGWGLAGICPGPGIFLAASGAKPIIFYWWPTFLLGSFLAQRLK